MPTNYTNNLIKGFYHKFKKSENNAWLVFIFRVNFRYMTNKEKYKKEIKSLRNLLNDNEYTRTLGDGYHQFLSDMHRKLVGSGMITMKMLDSIQKAIRYYAKYNDPIAKVDRDKM